MNNVSSALTLSRLHHMLPWCQLWRFLHSRGRELLWVLHYMLYMSVLLYRLLLHLRYVPLLSLRLLQYSLCRIRNHRMQSLYRQLYMLHCRLMCMLCTCVQLLSLQSLLCLLFRNWMSSLLFLLRSSDRLHCCCLHMFHTYEQLLSLQSLLCLFHRNRMSSLLFLLRCPYRLHCCCLHMFHTCGHLFQVRFLLLHRKRKSLRNNPYPDR